MTCENKTRCRRNELLGTRQQMREGTKYTTRLPCVSVGLWPRPRLPQRRRRRARVQLGRRRVFAFSFLPHSRSARHRLSGAGFSHASCEKQCLLPFADWKPAHRTTYTCTQVARVVLFFRAHFARIAGHADYTINGGATFFSLACGRSHSRSALYKSRSRRSARLTSALMCADANVLRPSRQTKSLARATICGARPAFIIVAGERTDAAKTCTATVCADVCA